MTFAYRGAVGSNLFSDRICLLYFVNTDLLAQALHVAQAKRTRSLYPLSRCRLTHCGNE